MTPTPDQADKVMSEFVEKYYEKTCAMIGQPASMLDTQAFEVEMEAVNRTYQVKDNSEAERRKKNARQLIWDVKRDWDDLEPITEQFLIPDVIPLDEVTLVVGAGGRGKSTLLSSTCAEVASKEPSSKKSGLPWFWKIDEVHRGKGAAYVSFEDKPWKLRQRFKGWMQYHWPNAPDHLEDNALHIFNERGVGAGALFGRNEEGETLWLPVGLSRLAKLTEMNEDPSTPPLKLLVVDPTAAAFAGSEIDRAQVRAFIGPLGRWAASNNCAAVLITHPPKNTGGGEGVGAVSGSTDWVNGVRSVIEVGRVSVRRSMSKGEVQHTFVDPECSGYDAFRSYKDNEQADILSAVNKDRRAVSSLSVLKSNGSASVVPKLMVWMRHASSDAHALFEWNKSTRTRGEWKAVLPKDEGDEEKDASHPLAVQSVPEPIAVPKPAWGPPPIDKEMSARINALCEEDDDE